MTKKHEYGAFNATSANISDDHTTTSIDMRGYSKIALQAVVSGTATLVGPIYLQGSMDGGTTWTTIEDAGGTAVTGATLASGAGGYSDGGISNVAWPLVRFFFDRTSGTGTITFYVTVSE
jgi:hypothetical protein